MTIGHQLTYKRNQVERAIAMCSGVPPKGDPDGFKSLRIELKRLLDRDRRQADDTGPQYLVRWAFHNAPPPGSGVDVIYTAYEAFALLIALRLMRGGLTQARSVQFLRDLRAPLAGVHYEIMQARPHESDAAGVPSDVDFAIRDGCLIQEHEQMIFLVALAGEQAEAFDVPSPLEKLVSGNICRKIDELHQRLVSGSHHAHPLIVVELINAAYQLDQHLRRIPPRSRGRG